MTPVNRVAKRLLARREIARPSDEKIQSVLETGQDAVDRKHLCLCGRKLDRQRQAIEATTNLGDARCVLRRQREAVIVPPRPAA